ncbi:MAG: YfiR family protein [Desulfobacterales bacterium]|nr:YfiR family protein [Desulfobacterales bacterium]
MCVWIYIPPLFLCYSDTVDWKKAEYLIKLGFIYNFCLFTNWPLETFSESNQLVLCILGENPFGSTIFTLEGKMVFDRSLNVRFCNSLSETNGCNILFIAESQLDHLSDIMQTINQRSVLTIADAPGLAEQGIMINLIKINDQIRFEINMKAVEHANLKISSQLLNLAKIVNNNNE